MARHDAYLILSHARGHQSQMTGFSEWPDDAYDDIVARRAARARARARAARSRAAACAAERVWLDPGLGFSKNARHSLELLARLRELADGAMPLVVGTGRKSFISAVQTSPPEERLGGTIAASLWASRLGAQVLRVHDVAAVRQALAVDAALERSARPEPAGGRTSRCR